MPRYALVCLSSLFLAAGAFAQQPMSDPSPRIRLRLDAGWQYQPGQPGAAAPAPEDGGWQAVTLPHTWNATDALDRDVAYRRGIGWYQRRLEVPASLRGKRLFLFFEGANQVADVWVNGQEAGHHVGGYTAFALDVTSLVAPDRPNLVVVRVDNRHSDDIPPLRADFTFYGGIYRDVWLIATEALHLDVTDHASPGVFVDAPGLTAERAVVRTRLHLRNDAPGRMQGRVVSTVLDPAGNVVAQATSPVNVPGGTTSTVMKTTSPIKNPRLWSPDEPNLYTVRTEVWARMGGGSAAGAGSRSGETLVDRVDVPLGLRFYSFDAQKGFFLNGKPLQLHGVNRHQDFRGLGNAVPDAYHRRDIRTIKENGFNFLRLAHYPQDPAVLDEADRVGLILWEEVPLVDYITQSEAFSANAENMVTDMVRQHYDHPSVFFWGYMNEIMLTPPNPKPPGYDESVVALAKRLNARAKLEDATRPTVMAIFGQDPLPALHEVPDILGLNLYFGWYYGKLPDFGTYLDSLHAARPSRPLMISEYGANGDLRVHAPNPVPFDYSEDYQRRFHEATFPRILDRPWLLGSALWNMFDFGAYGRDDAQPNVNDKGLYTFDRQPKDVAFYYRAKLRREPLVYIAARAWPLRAGSSAADRRQLIVVYSNLDSVELLQDGASVGVQRVENARAEYAVQLHDGENVLEARATGTSDERRATSTGTSPSTGTSTSTAVTSPSPAVRGEVVATDRFVVTYQDRAPLFTKMPGKAAEIAVNAGGATQYVKDGVAWEADRAYAPGSWGFVGGQASNTHRRILGSTDDPLLQTTREGAAAYRFDVPDGRYEVELRFVETKHAAAGERVFGVVVNGVAVAPALDLAAAPGRWHAHTLDVTVDAVGGTGVRVELPAARGESTVSALRVRRTF